MTVDQNKVNVVIFWNNYKAFGSERSLYVSHASLLAALQQKLGYKPRNVFEGDDYVSAEINVLDIASAAKMMYEDGVESVKFEEI